MSSHPLVSVILPFFNAESFIEEAIQSVLAQSLESWQLLLIDDGSTDKSTSLARRYAVERAGQIRYLEHEDHANLGKSTSRNLGVSIANGRYVAFLDADDVFLPHKLQHQTTLLQRHQEAIMVYGTTEYWVSWSADPKGQTEDWRGELGVTPDMLYVPPQLLTVFLKDAGSVPCLCGLMADVSVVKAVGSFDESLQNLYEDQVFLAKMILAGPVFVESGCGERYRQHPRSSSALAIESGEYHPTRPNRARRVFLHWLEGYLDALECTDPDLRSALSSATWPYRHPVLSGLMRATETIRRRLAGLRGASFAV